MKATSLFFGSLAILAIISCQKELSQAGNSTQPQAEIITCSFASNGDDTKTYMGRLNSVIWSAGDEIMLFDGISKTQKLTIASSGTPSSTVGVIEGGTKFNFMKPDGWAKVYAVYPYGACADGFSAASPVINFADQDGSFAKANISAGVAVSGQMTFKNVGAILSIYNLNVDVQSVVVPVAELANNYQLTFSNDTPSLTSVPATHSNVFTVQNWSNETKYFGVPASTIAKGSAFVYRSSSNAIIGSYVTGSENTTAISAKYELPRVAENGMLPGLFSVSADTKVRFSKGNLRAKKDDTTWKWGFYDNQYGINSYPTTGGARTPAATDTEIDLFCWGYDATGSLNPIEDRTATSFTDWGTAIDDKGTWRTLTHSEWAYLLNIGKNSSGARTQTNRYAKANVKGVKGLIVFPDGFNGSTAVTGQGIAAVNDKYAGFPSQSVPDADWMALEGKGCVFLPMSGMRLGNYMLEDVGSVGFYWSSSTSVQAAQAYHIQIADGDADTETDSGREFAFSVRLVTVIE